MCRKMGMVTKSSSFGWTCSQHSIAKREPEEKRYLNYMCWSADRKIAILNQRRAKDLLLTTLSNSEVAPAAFFFSVGSKRICTNGW
ncbi:uncharacterized protein LOC144543822 isoform X5 [Carex rostrata]